MKMKQKSYLVFGIAMFVVVLAGCLGGTTQENAGEPTKSDYEFYDVDAQTPVFISYYSSIKLTPEQTKIKEAALSSMPAPCCSDYSMASCCCPCNFAKSVWGLSNYLIVEEGYNVEQLKDAASKWIDFAYTNGYAGDACYKGRCGVPFDEDGCGGMTERLVL
jgi:hypothetical protein